MYTRYIKRVLDLVLALLLLVCTLPITIIVCVISIFVFKFKILFVQKRKGYKGRYFKVLKFTTMTNNKDANGNLLLDSERRIAYGDLLRKTSIDELPQLFNVLKGDMSMIGPRPLLDRYVTDCDEVQLGRYNVKPGITGLAQVCGRNTLSYKQRFKYDVWYIDNLSFVLDMKILFRTVGAVVNSKTTYYIEDIESKY